MPRNITQTPDKLMEIENIVQADIGFYSADYVSDLQHKFPVKVLTDESKALEKFHNSEPEDISMIMFTSGTSGVPKAVPIRHQALGHNIWETSEHLNIKPEDRILINTPPYTTSSIIHVLTMLVKGASVVSERGFLFGAGILDQISEFGCTGFGGVPVHFSRLLATLKEGDAPKKLRFLMNSGEHLPVPVIKELRKELPSVQIYCVYGLTEVAGRLCILAPEMLDDKIGSVGLPLEGMTVTVRDESGRALQPFEEGEVCVDGPCLMNGYMNNPDANAISMTPYGFSTGDVGYLDKDNHLFLLGRNDDIFKVGGEKVSVKMIEDAVFGFEDFEEFLVAPFHDEHMGNIPCLYYVLKEGMEFNRKGLFKQLRKILPSTHIPAKFIRVSSIPRTSSGKPIRPKL